MSSPPKPRVRRERDRFEELERRSRGELKERASCEGRGPSSKPQERTRASTLSASATAPAVQMPLRAPPALSASALHGHGLGHRKSRSASSSSANSSSSPHNSSPTRSDRPTTATTGVATTPGDLPSPTYPNYYDYSENAEIFRPQLPQQAPARRLSFQQQSQQQQQPTQAQALAQAQQSPKQSPKRNMPMAVAIPTANMAMQVPIGPNQPQQPHPHAGPQQRLVNVDRVPSGPANNSSSRPPSSSGPPQLTTAQLAQGVRNGSNANTRAVSGPRDGNRPPSYAGTGSRSPEDDIFPPNKVDLDAARFRHAQQQQSRRVDRERTDRDRDRDRSDRERDRPAPPAKDRRPSQAGSNDLPFSMTLPNLNTNMAPAQQHGRPVSPDSLRTPIQRLPTPSIFNSVLQPLDAKVVEYGSLMGEAQGDMARLDEEMRALQERQRQAEQRFLEAKAKHDEYHQQYTDVERALRGEFTGTNRNGNTHREVSFQRDVPPMPSMPSLQQYGVGPMPDGPGTSRSGSGNLLNGGGQAQGGAGMRSQRTVSIQSDADSLNGFGRPGSKRGRWSRVFGIGA